MIVPWRESIEAPQTLIILPERFTPVLNGIDRDFEIGTIRFLEGEVVSVAISISANRKSGRLASITTTSERVRLWATMPPVRNLWRLVGKRFCLFTKM